MFSNQLKCFSNKFTKGGIFKQQFCPLNTQQLLDALFECFSNCKLWVLWLNHTLVKFLSEQYFLQVITLEPCYRVKSYQLQWLLCYFILIRPVITYMLMVISMGENEARVQIPSRCLLNAE